MAIKYTRIQTNDATLNRVQDSINTALQQVNDSPFVGGTLLGLTTVNTTVTAIPHKLGYTPTVIFISPPNTPILVYNPQASDSNYIYLQTSVSPTGVNIWVK